MMTPLHVPLYPVARSCTSISLIANFALPHLVQKNSPNSVLSKLWRTPVCKYICIVRIYLIFRPLNIIFIISTAEIVTGSEAYVSPRIDVNTPSAVHVDSLSTAATRAASISCAPLISGVKTPSCSAAPITLDASSNNGTKYLRPFHLCFFRMSYHTPYRIYFKALRKTQTKITDMFRNASRVQPTSASASRKLLLSNFQFFIHELSAYLFLSQTPTPWAPIQIHRVKSCPT